MSGEGLDGDHTLHLLGNNSMCDGAGFPTLKLLLQAARNQIPNKIGLQIGSEAIVSDVKILSIIKKGPDNFFRDSPPPPDSAERKRKATTSGLPTPLTPRDLSAVSTETIDLSQRQELQASSGPYLPPPSDDPTMELDDAADFPNVPAQPLAKVPKPR